MALQDTIFSKHLEEDERIRYVIHKHWVTAIRPVGTALFFGVLLPWALYFFGFSQPPLFWIYALWTLFGLSAVFSAWLDWYADAWILTNTSIVHVEWNGPFRNIASRTLYEDMLGLTYEVDGFWGTMLRYGNINIRIATGNAFDFTNVANPKQVETNLITYQQEYLENKNVRDATALKDLISDMLAIHMRHK